MTSVNHKTRHIFVMFIWMELLRLFHDVHTLCKISWVRSHCGNQLFNQSVALYLILKKLITETLKISESWDFKINKNFFCITDVSSLSITCPGICSGSTRNPAFSLKFSQNLRQWAWRCNNRLRCISITF